MPFRGQQFLDGPITKQHLFGKKLVLLGGLENSWFFVGLLENSRVFGGPIRKQQVCCWAN